MELTGVVILVALVLLVWRESKASVLRGAARNAIIECEEEIQALRGGVMAGTSVTHWQSDAWERRRLKLLEALHRFHRLSYAGTYKEDLTDSSVPSFQDRSEWTRWTTLAQGPKA